MDCLSSPASSASLSSSSIISIFVIIIIFLLLLLVTHRDEHAAWGAPQRRIGCKPAGSASMIGSSSPPPAAMVMFPARPQMNDGLMTREKAVDGACRGQTDPDMSSSKRTHPDKSPSTRVTRREKNLGSRQRVLKGRQGQRSFCCYPTKAVMRLHFHAKTCLVMSTVRSSLVARPRARSRSGPHSFTIEDPQGLVIGDRGPDLSCLSSST
jgi:hypothetical protein